MRFASGTRLGPFEIVAPLGAGGMGEVYRARDTRLDRTVAIKVLPAALVDTAGRQVERFRHEARMIARITHPNICTLHDVGEDGSAIFLVMEHLDGTALARRLEEGPLPLALALRIAIGIADALDHAHRLGVVHRDLKPANVMLTRDSVKLLDFGLAKLRERDQGVPAEPTQSLPLTEAGVVMGTVPYMAPEQIEGREVDARTDIFAFGIVLYEMLCGRRPFTGDTRASLWAAIVGAEPPSVSSIQTQTPASLERLIRRCLAKDPDDRWQTARDLAAELRWIAEDGPRTTSPDITQRSHRAALWGGLAGAALTAVVVAAIVSALWPKPTVAEYRQVTYRRGIVSSARFTPDGQNFVYSASWEGQPYGAFLGRPESADTRDLQLNDARILSISRAGDMAVLFGPQNVQRAFGVRTLAHIPMAGGARRDVLTGVMDADWIPGTNSFAIIRDPGDFGLWNVEFPAGTAVHEARAAWSLRVSPDGSRVAFFEGPMLFGGTPEAMITVIDRSGRKSTVTKGWAGYGLAWAPSGAEIWFTATRATEGPPYLHAVSLSGTERTVHRAPDWLVLHDISVNGSVLLARNSIRVNLTCKPPGDAPERDLTWQVSSSVRGLSPDGQTVVFEDDLGVAPSGDPTLLQRRLSSGPAIPIGEGREAALSPDGKWVLALSGDRLVLWPTGPGAMIPLSKGNVAQVGGGAWLDDKRIVFTGDIETEQSRVYLQEIPGGTPTAITPTGVFLARKGAVRDQNSVLIRRNRAWALFPVLGGEAQPLAMLKPAERPVHWSDGGRYLYAVANAQGERSPTVDVFRLELATGARVLWKTLTPTDPVGVEDLRDSLVMTPDAQSYCYSYMRRLGDLFVVNGLK
jgi:eukaryotic-like serine/threonine-protein kinase